MPKRKRRHWNSVESWLQFAKPYIDGFENWLQDHGYTPSTIEERVRLLAGWADWMHAAGFVNKKFPSVTVEAQQEQATGTAIAALKNLDAPNLAFGLSLSEAREILLSEKMKAAGVKDVRLTGSKQLVRMEIDFES